MLSWKTPSAVQAVRIAFAVSIAAAQSLLLASASQAPKTTGSASGSPAQCEELNKKARGLLDSGKSEEARTLLNAGIQACAGASSPSEKARLAAALQTLGVIESTAQPQEALAHFRRAMALDPEQPAEQGMAIWSVECSGNRVYTVIVGRTGETTVMQKSK